MNRQSFDLVTCTCSVTAAEPIQAMMSHYLSAFHISDRNDADVAVTLRDDLDARTRRMVSDTPPYEIRSSHREQQYRVWTREDHDVLIPDGTPDHVVTVRGNHITVSAEMECTAATIGVRVIRQLIMRGGEACGGRVVHAGAVAVNGDGVLVGGHPGAGKTSILTRLVEDHGATALSNDRTVLFRNDDTTWQAVGVPLAWRFTPEGIGGSSRLTETLAHRAPRRGRALIDGKVELTPWEVGQTLHCPVRPTLPVTRLVVLMRSPQNSPATPEARFLRRHLDFGAADFFAYDWLGIRPYLPKTAVTDSDPSLWWAMLADLPVQVIHWRDPAELARVAAIVAGGR